MHVTCHAVFAGTHLVFGRMWETKRRKMYVPGRRFRMNAVQKMYVRYKIPYMCIIGTVISNEEHY